MAATVAADRVRGRRPVSWLRYEAPEAPDGATEGGAVFVYSGGDYELMRTWLGEEPGGRFGSSLGKARHAFQYKTASTDVLIGAPGEDSIGRVYCYSGLTGELLYVQEGSHEGDQFGASVAGIGDIDTDSICDIIVGAATPSVGGCQRQRRGRHR
jgi:hypothetical protein